MLGTGGGGDPYVGSLLAARALAAHAPVHLVPLADLPDDAVVVFVAGLGAPTVMVEKLPDIEEVLAPLSELARDIGRSITHIGCAEIGGINSTIPVAAAAALGVPIVDADGMGRAFPELQMVLPTLYGVSASPLAFADDKGNSGLVHAVDNRSAERIARAICIELGCSIMIGSYVMDGATARAALVPDSLSRSIAIGEAIDASRAATTDPARAVVDILGGRALFEGKVIDVERITTGGFARGRARIRNDTSTLELSFQNEHLVATVGSDTVVTTPDLIIVLEADTGEAITTESLRYGQRARVLAAPSDPRWHRPDALAIVGPHAFGYEVEGVRFDESCDREPALAQGDGS